MPEIGRRKALLLAVVFAAVVVAASTIGPGLGGLPFALLPLTACFVALYFVVRWAVAAGLRDAGGDTGSPTAREVLNERYARGEIDGEDYERVRSRPETP